MLRGLIDDFRDLPATMALCGLWVVVFLLMVLDQAVQGAIPTPGRLFLGIPGARSFGAIMPGDLFQGEIWRPLTATFVHTGLLHIGMNLFMMYQLGGLVESWYGPWQFLAIYVVIGAGGNVFAALVRHALGAAPRMSAGGSTVILGLAALCAVVGWRSRTRIGDYLRSQMVWLLIATALLGQIVPIVDNWGHAGGALVGALLGFAHRTLIRAPRRPMARWAGGLAVVLVVASGAAQIREDRLELAAFRRWQAATRTIQSLQEIASFYRVAVRRSRFEHMLLVNEASRHIPSESIPGAEQLGPGLFKPLSLWDSSDEEFRAALERYLDQLGSLRADLGTGPTAADFQQLQALLGHVFIRFPSDRIVREFAIHLSALVRRAQQNQETARLQLETLRHQARLG
jgi:rhomboid protease GluP